MNVSPQERKEACSLKSPHSLQHWWVRDIGLKENTKVKDSVVLDFLPDEWLTQQISSSVMEHDHSSHVPQHKPWRLYLSSDVHAYAPIACHITPHTAQWGTQYSSACMRMQPGSVGELVPISQALANGYRDWWIYSGKFSFLPCGWTIFVDGEAS